MVHQKSESNGTINVSLTGAAGQIAYALIPHLINGSIFKQRVNLHLLDIEPMARVLEGVIMEIEDYASPHLASITANSDPLQAFAGCDVAILVGAMPRKEGMQRKDLLKANAAIFKLQGQALDRVANKNCKVLVVGNPANTNAFIVSEYAKSLPKENFSALTRLDHNRALSILSGKLGVPVSKISGVIVWGNHSNTQFPDTSNVTVDGVPLKLKESLGEAYINDIYIPKIQNRGAEVIAARKLSSAMSAAKAIADHLTSWLQGTAQDEFVSMAVVSDGSYGTPVGTFFSFPCKCQAGGKWEIVKVLQIDDLDRIKNTSAELESELNEAKLCLVGSPDLITN